MSRRMRVVAVVVASMFSISMVACAQTETPLTPPSSRSSGTSAGRTAQPDGIVDRALAGVETTAGPFVSGDIVGYLVDYTAREGDRTGSILEVVVLKDGSVRRFDNRVMNRPRGAFGRAPGARLGPEPSGEAVAREQAIANARRLVATTYPDMASSEAFVFDYLVRLKRADGSTVDVWVDSSGMSAGPMEPSTLKDWRP